MRLEQVARLVAGEVSFHPQRPLLAHAAGDTIRALGDDGKATSKWSLGRGTTDVRFAPDGALWVLSQEALVRAVDGVETCRATGLEVEQILGVAPAGSLVLGQVQGLETGVWGALVTVSADCKASAETTARPAPTALDWEGADRWVGTTALVGPGPSREGPPAVLAPTSAGKSTFPALFRDDTTAQRVADLVVEGAALVVADTGAWELWSLDGSRKMATGTASLPSAEWIPGTTWAAVGVDLVSLYDGAVVRDALPSPVVAISPDGARWVLGPEEDRDLWRRLP